MKKLPSIQRQGCGNPNCRVCGPNAGETRDYSDRPESARPTEEGIDEAARRIRQRMTSATPFLDSAMREMARQMGGGAPFNPSEEVAVELKPAISEAYRRARGPVSKLIHKAPQQGFDDIIGNDEALAQLREAIEAPVRAAELYQAYGMRAPRGALLSGPPGCGKTMFAKATACEMSHMYETDVEYILASTSDLQSKYVGQTERLISDIFRFARVYAEERGHPLLVFMDEADALLPDRTGRMRAIAPWEESQVATFLAEMDGMNESGAFVLLATNRPEALDQAVLRDGRCDFKIRVERPGREAVEQIVHRGLADRQLAEGVPLQELSCAAAEALCDPYRVIQHTLAVNGDESVQRNFTLEDIVSGAMAASIAERSSRRAFSRDRAAGATSPSGVSLEDVLGSVDDIFRENVGLDHSYALQEFAERFKEDLQARSRGRLN